MATTPTQTKPSKRASDEEREESPPKRQNPVPSRPIYPNEQYLCRRDEYHDMINHHNSIFHTRTSPRTAMGAVCEAFESVFVRVRTWATVWGKEGSLSHLSDADKQEIIASLDGYCVQDDWDSIRRNLPPAARVNFAFILVETMLNQFICAKFIDSPFWFLDGKTKATDSDTQSDFHKRFQYVYEKLLSVSRDNAAWWKSIIVGKLNDEPCVFNNLPPTPVGRTTIQHRKTLVKAYTDELMRSRLLKLLLRDDALTKYQRSKRKTTLRLILETASQAVVHGDGGLYGNTNIIRLPDLPRFNTWTGQMLVHPFHAGFEPVEEGRVLIVTRPCYSYLDIISLNHFAPMPPWMVNRAEVLVAPKGRKARARWAAAAAEAGDDDDDDDCEDTSQEDDEDDETEENAKPVRDLPPLRESYWRQ
ncbi:hypothetical protein AbraIFM66951_007954 [Aspergillus brasiliensis]|uniref:Uncharacterized protein n=1 Tax=Aspergillus brasiliensis TaxID=319629 RepID=A0A9W5YU34_9EURO|nr:hypothetical protein AbraCBS73388_008460 [Aspergillus brasiliensis]GKZ45337.1 hypothetical protein AbraIFM66951_007954 [Aspergillus brasiliensis]